MTLDDDMVRWLNMNRKLRAENLVLRQTLSQARQTIELLNQGLNKTGDSSHNEWAIHMLIQIDRILNPEYFINAPAVDSNNT